MSGQRTIAVMLGAGLTASLSTGAVLAGWWLSWPPLVVGTVAASTMAISTCLTGVMLAVAMLGNRVEGSPPEPLPEVEPLGADWLATAPPDASWAAPPSLPPSDVAALPPLDQVPLGPVRRALESLAAGQWTALPALAEGLPETLRDPLLHAAQRWQDDRHLVHEYLERHRQRYEVERRKAEVLTTTVQRLNAQVDASMAARDAFLSRMSHELRTPLNAILGYSEMLEEDLEDDDLRTDAQRIRSSASNLLGTVTAVLDITQLQSGSYRIVPQRIDIEAMALEIGRAIDQEARTNGNVVEIRVAPHTEVTLDRRMVHSILLNLASNGCKYTKNGLVRLQAALVGDRLRLVVSDNGIGMTARQIEAALTPFSQADTSSTRRYDGSGLGLSVVHGFVEAMGGQLRIDSQPGQGAVIDVDLPDHCMASNEDDEPGPTNPLDEQPTMLAR